MFRRLLPLLALFALAGCWRSAPVEDADPALWVVRDADTTIYLFGTIHVLRPHLGWFDSGVKDAFDRSDQLVLETVLPDPEAMQALFAELGTDRTAPKLPDRLPAASARKLDKALDQLGRSPGDLDHAEPWYAATTVAMLPVRELGYDPSNGAEEVLKRAAEKAGKPVIGLETAREQLSYFDRLSDKAQERMLVKTLDGLPRAPGVLRRMIAAWRAGDADGLAALMNADLGGAREVRDTLIVARNRRWAAWIAARLNTPGTAFVAVGAGHLAGQDSVQAMLAKDGLKAVRVQYQ